MADHPADLLDRDVADVLETLARAVHDEWARGRIEEGWRYGPHHDDTLKQHPRLVPYEDLPEAEKNYDRATAAVTITTLIGLGFRVERG